MTRLVLAGVLSAFAMLCSACGDPQEAAVEAAFYDLENALNRSDGATAVAMYSADSFTICDALLKHAMESDSATIRRLAPASVMQVFMMRNRCDPQRLEQMDGAAWIKYATNQGWYQYEEDPDRPEYLFEVGAIQITTDGAGATAELLADGVPMRNRVAFVYEDDRWKRHFKSELDIVDEQLRQWVSGTRISLYDLLEMWEMEEHGEVRSDLWEPMRTRRR